MRKDDEGVLAELLVLVAGRVGRRSGRRRHRQDRVVNLGGLCILATSNRSVRRARVLSRLELAKLDAQV